MYKLYLLVPMVIIYELEFLVKKNIKNRLILGVEIKVNNRRVIFSFEPD